MRRILPFFVVFAALAAFADEPPPFVPGLLPAVPEKGIGIDTLSVVLNKPEHGVRPSILFSNNPKVRKT